MDLNNLRSLVTLISLVLFVGLMVWTYRPARKPEHDAAAQLVFEGEALESNGGVKHRE